MDVRQRQQELRPARVAELGPLGAEVVAARGRSASTTSSFSAAVDRADRVDDRAARPHALGGGAQQRELQLRQRLRAPAQVGPRREDAEPEQGASTSARSKPVELRRELERVGVHDRDVRRAEPARRSPPARARGPRASRRRRPRPRELRRLAARAPRRGRACARRPARRRRARRAASRGSAARRGRRSSHSGGMRSTRARRRASGSRSPRTSRDGADDRLRRLVLRPQSARASSAPELAPPGLGDPVRVGVRSAASAASPRAGRASSSRQPLREPPHDRVRERRRRARARRARTSSTDSFTAACGRDAVEEAELVGAEPQRRAHGRVELAHRPAAERVDRVVERADALHRAVGELLREGAVARVEPLGRRRGRRGRRRRRPRRRAAGRRRPRAARRRAHVGARAAQELVPVMRCLPSGCTSSELDAADASAASGRAGRARRSAAARRPRRARRCAARARGCG